MYENNDMTVYVSKEAKDDSYDAVTVVSVIYKGGK